MGDQEKAKDERVLLALDAAGVSIWDWDISKDSVTWSGRLDERLGHVAVSSGPGHESFFKMVHPDDQKMVAQAVKRSLDVGADYDVEFRLITTEGVIRWISGKGKVFFDQKGRAARMVGIERDITDHKQMQQRLQESHEDMRALMNSTQDIIIIIDSSGNILDINEHAAGILGGRREDLLGNFTLNYLPPKVASSRKSHLDRAMKHIRTYHFEDENRGRHFSNTFYPVPDERGSVSRLVLVARDITDSKKAEEALRSAEEKYRTLVENLNEGIWSINAEADTTFVNDRMAEILGYTVEEMVGKSLFHFMDGPGRDQCTKYLKRRMRGIKEQHDFEFIRKNGEKIIAGLETSPLFDENGNFSGAVAIVADVTEQRGAEKAMRQSEARFKGIFESSPIGIEIYGPDGKLIHINRACMDIFGIADITEVSGFYLFEDPNLPADAKELLHRGKMVGYETAFDFEKVKDLGLYKTSKYGIIYIYVIISPVFLEGSDSPSNYLVQVLDITERKATEERLIALENKFSAAFQISPDPLAITDIASGKIIDINSSFEEATGFSRDELIGHYTMELNIWANPLDRDEILRLLFDHKEVRDHPVEMRMKNGSTKDMLFSARFVTIADKCYLLSQAHDITEKKKLEEDLRKRSEQLEAMVEERTDQLKKAERLAAIGETAAMIGHDLRNPLQAVYCMIYLAREQLNTNRIVPADGQIGLDDIIDNIEENADYMNKIVSDIQDFARTMDVSLVRTDISFFIRETLSTIKIPDNVHVTVNVDEGVNELSIDLDKMKRIIINLMTNAINAMPEGGSISISVSKKGDLAKISVKDTGVGIPEEILSKLFLPLFTTRSKGVGLGLSVCKRMVAAMDGDIAINSRVGEGTEAIIEIPMR